MEHNEELVVNFKDLLFSALYSWKKILVAVLVCGIVLGGFQCFRQWKGQQTDVKPADVEQYQAQCQLYENKLNHKKHQIAVTEQKIADIAVYLENSVLMNADYHEVYKAKSAYYIDTDYQIQPGSTYQDTNHTSTLIAYYRYYLERYSLFEQIAGELGMETRYLIELVSLTVDADRGLCITVTHSEEAAARRIQDALDAEMRAVRQELNETVCPHTLSMIVDSCGTYVDSKLQTEQQSQQDSLLNLQSALITQQQELKALEAEGAPKDPAAAKGAGMKQLITAFIKWAIIGGVLGAGLVAVAVWMNVIFSDKITSPEKLNDKFSLRVLGTVPQDGKPCDRITRAIRRMERRPVEASEENVRFMAANIANYAGEGKNVLVCSDADSEKTAQLVQSLRSHSPAVTLCAGGSLLTDAETLKQLKAADAVVLAVVMHESRGKDIAASLKQIKELGKTAAGFVLID